MLDLRYPIGIFFLINAVVLVGMGAANPAASKVLNFSHDINLNLIWGFVMGAFGALMLGLSLMDKSKEEPAAAGSGASASASSPPDQTSS